MIPNSEHQKERKPSMKEAMKNRAVVRAVILAVRKEVNANDKLPIHDNLKCNK